MTLLANADHETKSSYSFTVTATDAAGNSDSQVVTLGVTDLDDADPVITSGSEATTIEENSGAGEVVYTVTSTDDGDISGGVTYSISGEDAAYFSIGEDSGEVTLLANADHETKSSYSFTVTATDAAGNSDSQVVTLGVTDLDDADPVITSGSEATTIEENSGAGQVVYTASASDGEDISDGVTFSLEGEDAGAFSIDEDTGEVRLLGNPDAETQSSYSFRVVATDGAGNFDSQAVTLAINNVDEFPILFSDDNSNVVEVSEGLSANTAIGVDVNGSDADAGTTVSYAMVSDFQGSAYTDGEFTVDPVTGVVKAGATALVYDADVPENNNRTIYVQATSTDGSTAIQVYQLVITERSTDIGGNPGTSGLSYDIGDASVYPNDAPDDDDLFDDPLTVNGTAVYIRPGDRIQGLTLVTDFVPGVTALTIPDTFNNYGDDRVDMQQFEVYYGTYAGGIFTVTSTPGTTADLRGVTHTMILYDNDPDPFSQAFIDGLVFEGAFAENQWYLVDAGTPSATLNYSPLASEAGLLSIESGLYGTDAADTIDGVSGNDVIFGNGGIDTIVWENINASNGVIVNGGEGGDFIDATASDVGDDVLDGGAGSDLIYGGGGNDTITGGAGSDKLHGEAGSDVFVYAVGDASVIGFADGGTGSSALSPDNGDTFTGTEVIMDFDVTNFALSGEDTIVTGNVNLIGDDGNVGLLEQNEYLIVQGAYDTVGRVFTVGSGGGDSLLIYDADGETEGVQQAAIVLVGVGSPSYIYQMPEEPGTLGFPPF